MRVRASGGIVREAPRKAELTREILILQTGLDRLGEEVKPALAVRLRYFTVLLSLE